MLGAWFDAYITMLVMVESIQNRIVENGSENIEDKKVDGKRLQIFSGGYKQLTR